MKYITNVKLGNMKENKQTMPKWFNGSIYKEGDIVKNRFTGEECELNRYELSMYDLVMGCSLMLEIRGYNEKMAKDLQKGLDWFRKVNPKAYMILLD